MRRVSLLKASQKSYSAPQLHCDRVGQNTWFYHALRIACPWATILLMECPMDLQLVWVNAFACSHDMLKQKEGDCTPPTRNVEYSDPERTCTILIFPIVIFSVGEDPLQEVLEGRHKYTYPKYPKAVLKAALIRRQSVS